MQEAECRMQKAEAKSRSETAETHKPRKWDGKRRAWSSRSKEGILERAVAEGVIKSITVRHLISTCIGGGYRNARFGIEILVARC